MRLIAEAINEVNRDASVDSSIESARQHAAGTRRAMKGSRREREGLAGHAEPDDHVMVGPVAGQYDNTALPYQALATLTFWP